MALLNGLYPDVTPYNYVGNNPINGIDLFGEDWFYYQEAGDSISRWHWQEGNTYDYTDANGNTTTLTGIAGDAFAYDEDNSYYYLDQYGIKRYAWKDEFRFSYYVDEYGLIQQSLSSEDWGQMLKDTFLYIGGEAIGKFFSSFFKGGNALKPLGLGSTGRTIASNPNELEAMKQILSNPQLGEVISKMKPLSDPRWVGWRKMQFIKRFSDGSKVNIHYVGKWVNGVLEAVDDFKFK